MNEIQRSSDCDLFSDEVLGEPYETYRDLRDLGSAVYLERHQAWAVSRFDGVREVLRNWEGFSSGQGVALNAPMNEVSVGTVLASDPPVHTSLRRVLSERLSPGAVSALAVEIDRQADELVAALVSQGQFDAVQDLAAVFPISVVADLIGLPDEGRENLFAWGNAVFDGFGPENQRTSEALPLIGDMFEYLASIATRERLRPGSMGMSVYEAADRGEIDAESCIPLMSAYIAAGADTTINTISTASLLAVENPDQWRALKADPGLIRSAANEVLRYDSAVQAFARVTTKDEEVEGEAIPAGSKVWVIYGSANRDERKWADADSFDVARNPIDHMGFGHGIHRCAGSSLARIEMEAVLTSLVARVESIEIAGEPERRLNNTVRGLRHLPVSVTL